MEEKKYAEAPKAIRVIAILGLIVNLILIIMILVSASLLESFGPLLVFAMILSGCSVLLSIALYRNSINAAYIYIVLAGVSVILDLISTNWLSLIMNIIFASIVFSKISDMKLAQSRFENRNNPKPELSTESMV